MPFADGVLNRSPRACDTFPSPSGGAHFPFCNPGLSASAEISRIACAYNHYRHLVCNRFFRREKFEKQCEPAGVPGAEEERMKAPGAIEIAVPGFS
ncbi:MAG TPA: hypothetical protein VGS59_12905 [Candidatus Acidoferrales bacterium]|nr:hypothetical protein [Candidatus Acidoferrales bacterium]